MNIRNIINEEINNYLQNSIIKENDKEVEGEQ